MFASGSVMNAADQPGDVRDRSFTTGLRDQLFNEPATAIAHTRGDPILVLRMDPQHIIFASASAARMLGAATPEDLTAVLEKGDRAAWARLQHLARHLVPRPHPQMERLRLPVAGTIRQVTLLCRAIVDDDQRSALLVVASGLDRGWLRQPEPDLTVAQMPVLPLPEQDHVPEQDLLSAHGHVSEHQLATEQAEPALASPAPVLLSGPESDPTVASQRFVWRADSNHLITHISVEGLNALGLADESWRGKSWRELIHEQPALAQLLTHLGQSSSWGGQTVAWSPALLLTLGATPLFKPVRLFAGWRGYGVVHPAPVEATALSENLSAQQGGETAAISANAARVTEIADLTTPPPMPAERPNEITAVLAPVHSNDIVQADNPPHSALLPTTPAVADRENDASDGVPDAAPPSPLPLTAAESRAFNEIGVRLAPQIMAHEQAGGTDAVYYSVEPASARETPATEAAEQSDHATLLDALPLGILIARAGKTQFINAPLLQHAGFADAKAYEAAGGADYLTARLASAPCMADTADDADPREVAAGFRLRQIEWQGEPASLLTADLSQPHDGRRARTITAEAEARDLRAILDTATDGVVTLDAGACMLSLNKSAEALFGVDGADCVGQPFTSLLQRDGQAAFTSYFDGVGSNGVASLMNDGRDISGRTVKGGHIPLFMTLGRIGTPDQPRFCGVLRDMTQWKKVEAELNEARREAERASAVKSEFLARISHEIRTPLSAILGFSEVMSEERLGPVGNERYREYIKDIHASGQHVMSLVNDLLDLSKIESGKLEMNFTSVDINYIANECIMLMQPVAAREHVVLRRSLVANLPPVVADERSLRQIMLNILSNAIKFNVSSGQVIVSTALTDSGHAVLRVRDTGTGMSEDDVQLAMEPFRQLPNATQKRGTGLGLPITRALIEANRASLVIRSRPNEGTMVEVAFPPTRVLAE